MLRVVKNGWFGGRYINASHTGGPSDVDFVLLQPGSAKNSVQFK